MFPSKPSIAINISDNTIEALELARDKDAFVVKSYSRVLLESGVVEKGTIVAKEKLTATVKKLLSQAQPVLFEAHDITLTIPESKTFAHTFRLPRSLPPKSLPAALMTKAQEVLPIEPQLMAADFIELGSDDKETEYLFVATYAALVHDYVSFFESLRLKVSTVTMESLALAAATVDESKDETVLLLDMGARTTIASVFRRGQLQETVNVNIAGDAITASIAEKLNVSAGDAEQRKIASGVAPGGGLEEAEIIQKSMQALKDELVIFIKYYEQQSGDKLDRVLLSGGTSLLQGLPAYIESLLGLPVALAAPLPMYRVTMQQSVLPKFMVVLGLGALALGVKKSMINFLSRNKRDWEMPKSRELGRSAGKIAGPTPVQTQQEVKKKRSRGVVLLALLAVSAVIFVGAWVWKKRGFEFPIRPGAGGAVPSIVQNLNFIIRPFSGLTPGPSQSLALSYTVSVGDAAPVPGEIRGSVLPVEFGETVSSDESERDLVARTLREQTGREPSAEDVHAAFVDYLVRRLWTEKSASYFSAFENDGRLYVPEYIGYDAVRSEPVGEPIDGVTQNNIHARFRALVIDDRQSFEKSEAAAADAHVKQHPDLTVKEKSYELTENPADGKIRLILMLQFEKR